MQQQKDVPDGWTMASLCGLHATPALSSLLSIAPLRITTCCLVCMTLITGIVLPAGANAADRVWSVEKLNGTKPWDKFVESSLPIRVEGRIGGFGGGQLRLLNCDAKFVIDSHKLRSILPKSTVELVGNFRKDGSRMEFAVNSIRTVPGYVEQYESKAARLKLPTPEDWMELGDWIKGLGLFYDDAELLEKGNEAYSKAIEVEYHALNPDDAEGRMLLARKMEKLKLSDRRKMELIHESLQIRWQHMEKEVNPDLAAWQKFGQGLADDLPGTDQVLVKPTRDLKDAYAKDPVTIYRKANDDLRRQLHRLFSINVTRARLLHTALPEGQNGDWVADQIEAQIPEEAGLAENQRKLNLSFRMANVGTATRSQVEDLADAFRKRDQNDMADQALFNWIKSHELRLKEDGVVGLLQLSDEYLNLLHNEAVAVDYLADAYRIDPTYDEIKTRFAALGYQLQNGRWSRSRPNSSTPLTSAQAMSSEIGIDMTASDLRKQMGQPSSLSRAITSRGITEVWSYGTMGSLRLVVRLEQKGYDNGLKVTDVSNHR